MRFDNIKITDNEVILQRQERQADGSTLTLELKNPSKPMPSFRAALQAFTGYAVDLVGVAEWAQDDANGTPEAKVTSVHLSEEAKTRRRGLMVTFIRKIERAKNRVAVYNTPLMHAPVGDQEGTNPGTYPQEVADFLATLEAEATKYWNGEREQTELPFEGKKADASAEGGEGEAGAGGEDQLAKRRGKKDRKAGTPGETMNPGKTEAPDDEKLRQLCLAAGRDMPIDAIARLTSTERGKVQEWAEKAVDPDVKPNRRPPEPDVLKKFATPALLEDVAGAQDGWTEQTPPPKADTVKSAVPAK